MPKKALLGILLAAACLTLACLCASADLLPLEWTPTDNLPDQTSPQNSPAAGTSTGEPAPVCVDHLSAALHQSEEVYSSGTELKTDFTLVTYRVFGDSIFDPVFVNTIPSKLKIYQEDTAAQEKLWDFFIDVIPANRRTQVTQFMVFTDGPNNTLGAVEQTDDPAHWTLEMDIQDGQNFPDLSSTLIHEFGHLFTLNDTQVTPDMQVFDHPNNQEIFEQEAQNCPAYFMFEGCSLPGSYINKFFQRFWPKIFAEWKAIDAETDAEKLDKKLGQFYDDHADQFVSSYAATSPEEDIAETFMYFIFTPRPAGNSIADQKILFFYEDPGLRYLREHILSHLCKYVEK